MYTELRVNPDGTLMFLYDDALLSLLNEGEGQIRRASYVEPNKNSQWEADLSPVGGPVLGPFVSREEALSAEVYWLRQNYL
jgi:hypothetical protein